MDTMAPPATLPDLVEAATPEQLAALKTALQQLGADLDAAQGGGASADPQASALQSHARSHPQRPPAAAHAAQPCPRCSGMSPPQGKEVVDIREEWSEELHGGSAPRPAQPARSATPAGTSGGWEEDAGDNGSEESDSGSVDSFEALMQRMDALEVGAEQLRPAGSGGEAAPRASAPAAAAASSGGPGKGKRPSSGFRPGFLLGKRLDAERPPAAKPARDEAEEKRHQREAAAAARREAAFTGRVVERPDGSPVEDRTSSGLAVAAPAAAAGAAVQQRQPGREGAGLPEPPAADAAQPRVSKFKLRRQGLAES